MTAEPPYCHVVADEVKDFGPAELRLLRALAPEGPDDVFLTGDAHHATRFVKRGDPTGLDCTFDEHTADVHDNRAPRWTLHHASRAPNLIPSTGPSVGRALYTLSPEVALRSMTPAAALQAT